MLEKDDITSSKCVNNDCPINNYCYTYNKIGMNLKQVKFDFFYIKDNHMGCYFYSNKKNT